MGCGKSRGAAPMGRLLEEYSVGQTLGEGAFGVVYACTNRKTGEQVAVKMVDKVETPVAAIKREAEMMRNLSHPNIVRCHQVFYERYFVCIVMDKFAQDLVDGLHMHMKERGKINCHDVVHIAHQMGAAIQYLHSKLIIHRDVKGDNYLMDRKNIADQKCRIALSDFGTACNIQADERLSAEVGTRIFWAPEVYQKNYSLKVDVWAMGVTMYGILEGRFPFKDDSDIKNRELKAMKKVHPVCEDWVKKMLTKDETKRMDANQTMAHEWIATHGCRDRPDRKGDQGTDDKGDTEPGEGGPSLLRVDGANDGVQERRRELVDRLNDEQEDKKANKGPKKGKSPQHCFTNFTITDKRMPGTMLKFEWWDKGQVQRNGILNIEGVSRPAADLNDSSPNVVSQMLQEHNIDLNRFGSGEAKRLDQFENEVQSGVVRLMLDASDYKKLVRVVDIVLMRLYTNSKKEKMLIETAEQFEDGRKRDTNRLPGTKREPYENAKETALRMLKEMLDMGNINVHFDFDETETFEEENESPSYPGVMTVYRKEIVEGYVQHDNPDELTKIGLPSGGPFSAQDARKNTKFLSWMPEKAAVAKQVKLRAEGSEQVSSLVSAPIGMNEDDMRNYLVNAKIDVELFGQNGAKTIKELSNETLKGECSITTNAAGDTIRVVDLVFLKIVDPVAGDTLVQTEQTHPNGERVVLNRLPGAKRRPDENQYLTVRRILRRQLKIDENMVSIDPSSGEYYVDEKPPQGYPKISNVYRKRVITVKLIKKEQQR
mmetsp:Transcript_75881/g.180306  ORF Transcript_75881/g.180306 Transcript_75881/m.180306 type:complete len:769 (+) Transcript_75881:82-2388(+)